RGKIIFGNLRGNIYHASCRRPAARKKRPQRNRGLFHFNGLTAYFSAFETLVKVVLSFVPTPWTTAIIATEMQAGIRPYSIAVAPDSSFTKRAKVFIVRAPLNHCGSLLLVRRALPALRCRTRI